MSADGEDAPHFPLDFLDELERTRKQACALWLAIRGIFNESTVGSTEEALTHMAYELELRIARLCEEANRAT